MKRLIAILILSLPGLVAAHEPCPLSAGERVEAPRWLDVGAPIAWQNAPLFDQQIL